MPEKQPKATRATVWCVAAGVVGVTAFLFCHTDAEPTWANQSMSLEAGSTGMVVHVQEDESRPTRVIVVEPQLRVMAVYEIAQEKAQIKFLSSRNLTYDLQMLGFNSVDPSPEDIKKSLEMQ